MQKAGGMLRIVMVFVCVFSEFHFVTRLFSLIRLGLDRRGVQKACEMLCIVMVFVCVFSEFHFVIPLCLEREEKCMALMCFLQSLY